MGEIIEISGFGVQETVERQRRRKLVDLLKEEMDGVDGRGKKWKMFKQRLGLSKMSCCGASWSFKATSNMDYREEDDDDQEEVERENPGRRGQFNPEPNPTQIPTPASGMNLASALAEERNFRAAQEWENGGFGPPNTAEPSPGRVSLIRLIEESNGRDEEREKENEVGNESMCCVCMGRKKGAAFIPCGHTFCRVCSREIWLNRGGCPLCNQSILEILDIF